MSTVASTVAEALKEDRAHNDATSLAVIPEAARARGRLVARAEGVLAGTEYADQAFRSCDPGVVLDWRCMDGERVHPDQEVLACSGRARGLLAAERTALNFLQQLSGTATLTAALVAAAGDVSVLDTRKTVPGLRDAQKAAVIAGGGRNHRRDLCDQLLLKENHFALSEHDFRGTVELAIAAAGGRPVGVEARTRADAEAALEAGADYVLLDNFELAGLRDAASQLKRRFPGAVLEASGGYGPDSVGSLRGTGVDRVSIGALTHSAPALDLSFYLEVAVSEVDA